MALDDGTGVDVGAALAAGVGDADGTTDGAELTSAADAGGLDDAAPESIPEASAATSRTSTTLPSAAVARIIRRRSALARTAAATGTASVGGAASASHPEDRTRADHLGRGRGSRGVRRCSQAPLLGDEGSSQRDRVLGVRIDRDRTTRRLGDHLGHQRDP